MGFCNDVVAKNDNGSHGEFINVEAPPGFSQRFGREVMVTMRHAAMIRRPISPTRR
jgi:hypothetical protein